MRRTLAVCVYGYRKPAADARTVVPTTDDELADHITKAYKARSQHIEDAAKVRKMWKDMMTDVKNSHDIAGLNTYTSVLQVCARCKSPEMAKLVFEEMKSRNLEPGHHSYVALASAHASVGQVDECIAILEKTGYESNAAKGTLLRALSKVKQTEKLMKHLHLFLDQGFKFSPRHAVVVLAGQADPRDAWAMLITLKNTYDMHPNTLMCNAALGTCINGPDVEIAESILRYMQERRIAKDASTWSSLCAVYSQACDLDKLAQILEAQVETGMPLNSHSYATYIRCCANILEALDDLRQGEKEKLKKQAKAMHYHAMHHGFQHSSLVHTNMLEVYILLDDTESIDELVEEMRTALVKPSSKFMTNLAAYRAAGEKPMKRQLQEDTSYVERKAKDDNVEVVVSISQGFKKPVETDNPLFPDKEELMQVKQGLYHGNMKLHKIPINTEIKHWVRMHEDCRDFVRWTLPRRPRTQQPDTDAWKYV
eukprot:TRINITY_DN6214_c0_g1_i1.p1 TRINITY_DN6214_c0_g1~~TRINITY_DN6214_c0_g1_i1.p1  ORF type:complete len:481 (+),score=109.12 TRINITY_DN6214_c0_g1_i1:1419-2861(+)